MTDSCVRTFTIKEQLEILSARSWAALVGTVRKRQAVWPVYHVCTKSHLPGHSPPASQAGRGVRLALYSHRPHCRYDNPMPELTLSPQVRDYELGYRTVRVVFVTDIVSIVSSLAGNRSERQEERKCGGVR